MKVFLSILILLLGIPAAAFTREPFKVSATMDELPLGRYLDVYEDTAANMRLVDIVSLPDANFSPVRGNFLINGFSESIYWARMRMVNESTEPRTVMMECRWTLIDHMDVYQYAPQTGWKHHYVGDGKTANQMEVRHRHPTIKMVIPPGESRIYISYVDHDLSFLPLVVFDEQTFERHDKTDLAFMTLLLGVILAICSYNFFLYLSVHRIQYLYYVFYNIMFLIFQILYHGIFKVLLLPDGYMDFFQHSATLATGMMTIIFIYLYTDAFLNMRKNTPRLHWLLFAIIGFGFFNLFTLYFSGLYNLSTRLIITANLITPPVIFLFSATYIFRSYVPAYFFLAAWLSIIIGDLLTVASIAGLIPFHGYYEFGMICGAAIEAVMMSFALGWQLQYELKHYLNMVETLVAERTDDIRSIFAHIRQGICALVTPQALVQREYSAHLENLLTESALEGRPIVDILAKHNEFSLDDIDRLRVVLASCINENRVVFDMNCHLLPTVLNVTDAEGTRRNLELEWNPITGKMDRLEKILLIVRDVTEVRKLSIELSQNRDQLAIFNQIGQTPRDKFRELIGDCHRKMDTIRQALAAEAIEPEHCHIIYLSLHTMKGNARIWGWQHLVNIIHDMENILQQYRAQTALVAGSELKATLQPVIDIFEQYAVVGEEKFGLKSNIMEIEIDAAMKIWRGVETLHPDDTQELRGLKGLVRDVFKGQICHKLTDLLRETCSSARNIAHELGKEEPTIEIQPCALYVSPQGQQLIRNVMVNLLSNIMDHGIETADERLAKGKLAAGRITVRIRQEQEMVMVEISDDGRGLNIDEIRRVAANEGLAAGDMVSDEAVGDYIFRPRISTRRKVTHISGRGMGMNAVRTYLSDSGGSIYLEFCDIKRNSWNNRDFLVVIRIPGEFFYD